MRLDDVKRAPLPLLTEDKWLHAPVWRQTAPRPGALPAGRWLVLTDEGAADAVCEPLVRRLTEAGGSVVTVRPARDDGERGGGGDGEYRVRPGDTGQIRELMRRLRDEGGLPERVVHLWTLGLPAGEGPLPGAQEVETALVHGSDTLVAVATAAADVGAEKWALDVVTCGTRSVTGTERIRPELSTLSGPVRGIPLEYPEVSCRLIDVEPVPADAEALAARIAAELGDGEREPVVALRNARRWLPDYETLPDTATGGSADRTAVLRERGVYLITGGLGGIGLAMAERLAGDCPGARLVLLGRTGLPPRETWRAALADPAAGDEVRRRLSGVLRLEELGAEVAVVTGDVSVAEDARRAVRTAVDRFGALHGVVHAAGLPGIGLMQFKTTADMRKVMAPKIGGTLALESALDGVPLDFLVLFSSITSATGGGPGQVDYSAANAFLDSCADAARARGGRPPPHPHYRLGRVAVERMVGRARRIRPGGPGVLPHQPAEVRHRLRRRMATAAQGAGAGGALRGGQHPGLLRDGAAQPALHRRPRRRARPRARVERPPSPAGPGDRVRAAVRRDPEGDRRGLVRPAGTRRDRRRRQLLRPGRQFPDRHGGHGPDPPAARHRRTGPARALRSRPPGPPAGPGAAGAAAEDKARSERRRRGLKRARPQETEGA
nr:KR domain-containing protein [Streptomyces sp. FXJ7.023]